MTIVYILGEDNMVTNALSHVPEGAFPGKTLDQPFCNDKPRIHATLSIMMDPSVLHTIHKGYNLDEFCKKIMTSPSSTPGVSTLNSLWHIGQTSDPTFWHYPQRSWLSGTQFLWAFWR
jgi:hypothetical protein